MMLCSWVVLGIAPHECFTADIYAIVARPNLTVDTDAAPATRRGYSLAGLLVGTLASEGPKILNLMRDYMGLV